MTKKLIDHFESREINFQKYFTRIRRIVLDLESVPSWNKTRKISSIKSLRRIAEISSDSALRLEFIKETLNAFWLRVRVKFSMLSDLENETLLPVVTTYLCESTFFVLTGIKKKSRSCTKNMETALRRSFCKKKKKKFTHLTNGNFFSVCNKFIFKNWEILVIFFCKK